MAGSSGDELVIGANANQALAEWKKLNQAIEHEAKALKEFKDANNAAAREQQKLATEGARLTEQHATAQERYNAKVQKLDQLLKANTIDQRTYNAELANQKKLLEQTGDAAGNLRQQAGGFAKEFITSVVGISGAIGGALAVVEAIKGEYDDLVSRQKAAQQAQQTFGEAMRSLGADFKADSSMQVGDLEPAVKRLMQSSGATDVQAARALSAALAGRGNMSNAAAVGIAEQALRILPGDAEATGQMAMRTGMLMNETGIADPRAALGLVADIKNTAAVAKLRDVGQSAIPAVMSATRLGASAEQGAELYTTINNLMADAEGASSRTAMEALMLQLRDFKPGDSVPAAQRAAFAGAATPDAMIDVMQSSPELRAAFLANSSFELKSKTSIESLLSGTDQARAARESARAGIGAPSADTFESFVGGINSLASQRLPQLRSRGEDNLKQYQLRDAGGAETAEARDIFESTIGSLDFPQMIDALGRRGARNEVLSAQAFQGMSYPAAAAATLDRIRTSGEYGTFTDANVIQLLSEQAALLRSIDASGRGGPPEARLGIR